MIMFGYIYNISHISVKYLVTVTNFNEFHEFPKEHALLNRPREEMKRLILEEMDKKGLS